MISLKFMQNVLQNHPLDVSIEQENNETSFPNYRSDSSEGVETLTFTRDLIRCIATVLCNLTLLDESIIFDSVFTSTRSSVTLIEYIDRCNRFMHTIGYELIVAMIFIDRFIFAHNARYNESILTPSTVHKIFATALALSQKYCNDTFYNLSYVSKVVGYSREKCVRCELEFLETVDGILFVSTKEYNIYNNIITKIIENRFL
jgi:hypothetical protein